MGDGSEFGCEKVKCKGGGGLVGMGILEWYFVVRKVGMGCIKVGMVNDVELKWLFCCKSLLFGFWVLVVLCRFNCSMVKRC